MLDTGLKVTESRLGQLGHVHDMIMNIITELPTSSRLHSSFQGSLIHNKFQIVSSYGLQCREHQSGITFLFSFMWQSNDDMISGVELLAYIPYFVAVAPKDA